MRQKPLFLRACRQMTGLKAEAFAKRHGFDRQAYLRLERSEGYLKDHTAHEILKALEFEGIKVSKQWILDGTGEPPQKVEKAQTEHISQEIDLFKTRKDAVTCVLDHDDFNPFLKKGDTVGGIFTKEKMACHNTLCIVSFKGNEYLASVYFKDDFVVTYTLGHNVIQVVDVIPQSELFALNLAPLSFLKRKNDFHFIQFEMLKNKKTKLA